MTEQEERIAETIVVSDRLPDNSLANNVTVWENRVVIRPYSPEGITETGLWVAKNDKFPKIWGHVLAIPERTLEEHPELRPGCMVIYKRFADEIIGYDKPLDSYYMGEELPVAVIHVEAIEAAIDPPLIQVRV